ncbi:MAG TPA: DUF1566 domain-containing protein [Candidatus Limnocylindrales bacterium]|nr:DUF1566 domain-containing protein [Candidatus Limnocylindrales bacterium]
MKVVIPTALFLLALSSEARTAETMAERDCEMARHTLVGKLAACLQKAEDKFVRGGSLDAEKRDESILVCVGKFDVSWESVDSKAAASGTPCPSVAKDEIRDFVGSCLSAADAALAGGVLPVDAVACDAEYADCRDELPRCLTDCSNSLKATLQTGQSKCYAPDGSAIACGGTGQDGEFRKGVSHAFVDNSDGTITDAATRLTWEKLSFDDSLHDYRDLYSIEEAVTVKVANLNAANFAGFSDWRVPNYFELRSLVSLAGPAPMVFSAFASACTPGCTSVTCDCWSGDPLWTSTSSRVEPFMGVGIDFSTGDNVQLYKPFWRRVVRAVRGGA